MKSGIRWRRVIAAAVTSEAAVIAVMLVTLAAYASLIAPGRTPAEYEQFGARIGYYVAPPASGVFTFLMALWVARKLNSHFVVNGFLVGACAVMVAAGFLFTAKPEDRPMYLASFAIRIAGGALGGLAAQARANRKRGVAAAAAGEAR
jgi:hypothetical protein